MINKKKIKFWPVVLSAVIVVAFIILKFNQLGAPEPVIENPEPVLDDLATRQNLVRDYLTSHLDELAPEPAELGGQFLITSTTFLDNNRVIVNYEDGHNSFTARASYILDYDQPLAIEDFTLIKKNEELLGQPEAQVGNDDLAVVAVKNDLAEKYQQDFTAINLTVKHRDQYHLRGTVNLNTETDTANKPELFLAAMVDGEFKAVFNGEAEDLDCEDLLQYDFSSDLLPECVE